MDQIAIVIGASGGISQTIIKQLVADKTISKIIGISRSTVSHIENNALEKENKVTWLSSDYSEESIEANVKFLQEYKGQISRVFITNGILQTDNIKPERALKGINTSDLHDVFHVNAVIPILWLSALTPLLSHKDKAEACVVSVFSARVGSIEDNKLGGWHSYRASKAALNMLLKGASIEFDRNRKNIRLIAFHPGTTDTPLSKPFQASVAKDKLFTPEFVANQLIGIMNDLAVMPTAKSINYLDWDNQPIAW